MHECSHFVPVCEIAAYQTATRGYPMRLNLGRLGQVTGLLLDAPLSGERPETNPSRTAARPIALGRPQTRIPVTRNRAPLQGSPGDWTRLERLSRSHGVEGSASQGTRCSHERKSRAGSSRIGSAQTASEELGARR